jgi:hypothetical protein
MREALLDGRIIAETAGSLPVFTGGIYTLDYLEAAIV